MTGRGIDGHYPVHVNGEPAGWVTSGGPSPTLGKNIGLCLLPIEFANPGQAIQVLVRDQPIDAVVVPTPFYKRAK
ncbi:MAG: glycine cleavage T C-terminal barrel domain-containing protein [Bryobacteraceae bacterium]